MKKRIVISIALLMILCLALAGCGQKGSDTSEQNSQANQNQNEVTIVEDDESLDQEAVEDAAIIEATGDEDDQVESDISGYEKYVVDGSYYDFNQIGADNNWELNKPNDPSSITFTKKIGDKYINVVYGFSTSLNKYNSIDIGWGEAPYDGKLLKISVLLNTTDENKYSPIHNDKTSSYGITEKGAELIYYTLSYDYTEELEDPFIDVLSEYKERSSKEKYITYNLR